MAVTKRDVQIVLVGYRSTVLIPLALLVVLLTLVGVGSWTYAAQEQRLGLLRAHQEAGGVSTSISAHLTHALRSVGSIVAHIKANPNWSQLSPTIRGFIDDVQSQNPQADAVQSIDVGPSFIIKEAWPNTQFSAYLMGMDTLNSIYRIPMLNAIQTDSPKMMVVPDGRAIDIRWANDVIAVMAWPIFLYNDSSENPAYIYPIPPTNCSVCYDAVKRQRIWGFVGATINLDTLLAFNISGLKVLDAAGFRYAVRARSNNASSFITVVTSATPPQHGRGSLSWSEPIPIMPGLEWTVEVQGGWQHETFAVVLSIGIFASVTVSVLLFAMLFVRRQNQMLLEAMVPQEVITQIRNDHAYDSKHTVKAQTCGPCDSAADRALAIMAQLLQGDVPALPDVLLVRTSILHNWDLYKPLDVASNIRTASMDADVAEALMNQLTTDHNHGQCMSWEVQRDGADGAPGSGAHNTDMATLTDALALLMAGPQVPPSRQLSRLNLPDSAQLKRAISATVLQVPNSPMSRRHSNVSVHWTPGAGDRSQHVPAPIVEAAEKLLAAAECAWQFDAFALDEATCGHPLSTLAYFLMHRTGLIAQMRLNPSTLARYLRRIESGYKESNPYHNHIHAADVLQSMHVILHQGGLVPLYAEGSTLLACYLAAVVHDFDHEGLTNDFLINTNHQLALTYNDKSPLENHHTAAAMSLLCQPEYNFITTADPKEMRAMRNVVIELVLATDMKQHFAIMSHFKTLHSSTLACSTLTTTSSSFVKHASFARNGHGPAAKLEAAPSIAGDVHSGTLKAPMDDVERLLALKVALKCSDLGHTAADLPVHKRWLFCLEEEFFRQGDAERAAGLPISPLFDRQKQGASKSQVGFYEFVVNPLFSSFAGVFWGMQPLLGHVTTNYHYWQQQEEISKAGGADGHPFATKGTGEEAV